MSSENKRWTRETWARERALPDAIKWVVEGGEGRHRRLYGAAKDLGGYVLDGVLTAADVETALTQAADQCGMLPGRRKEVTKTIRDGLHDAVPGSAFYPESVHWSSDGDKTPRRIRWRGEIIDLTTRRPVLESISTEEVGLPTVPLTDESVRLTWYPSLKDTQGEAARWTWAELDEAVASPMDMPAEGKASLPLWAAHEIEDDNRSQRPDGLDEHQRERTRQCHLHAIHALVLDYDDESAFSPEAVDRWWGAVRYVAHTSAHHQAPKSTSKGTIKPPGPRGRVIMPLSRPVTELEFDRIGQWAISCGRGAVGREELGNGRRIYYVPARTDGYWSSSNQAGGAIDVDTLLDGLGRLESEVTDAAEVTQSVLEQLDRTKDGEPKSHLLNLTRILDLDPTWRGRLGWNEFTNSPELDRSPVTDQHEGHIAVWLGQMYEVHPPITRIHDAVQIVCDRHRYHPVRQYLDRLTWDGVERLDHWLHDYAGCEDDSLSAVYGRKVLIAAVARVMRPGCKSDNVLVMKGAQGARKSTLWRTLASDEFFSDSSLPIGDKDGYQALQGVWIYEFPELDNIRRRDWSTVKAYLAAQTDRYRPSYGRNQIVAPRQVLFVATTNADTFLSDPSGSRRFWVREIIDEIEIERLQRDRDQLWAEAVRRYRAGDQWWLDAEEDGLRAEHSECFEEVDTWETAVFDWLNKRVSPFSLAEVFNAALNQTASAVGKADEMRMSALLKRAGWQKDRSRVAAAGRAQKRPTVWVKA